MPKRLDLAGQKFGYLTVVKFEYVKNGRTYWDCLCSCGKKKIVNSNLLVSGKTKSCGCFRKEQSSKAFTTHGGSPTNKSISKLSRDLYNRWISMRVRCTPSFWKKRPTYTGVNYSPLWETFEGFRDNQPEGDIFAPNLVLSRIGDQGDYTPENCRWITNRENTLEMHSLRENKHRLTTGELAVSVARQNGIHPDTFYRRVKRGLSVEEACKPKGSKNI